MAEGVAKMHGRKAAEKRRLERLSKKMNAKYFVLEIVLGHPCVPRVRMDTGSDKRRV